LKISRFPTGVAFTGLAVGALLLVTACDKTSAAESISITPVSLTQPMNGTYQFSATARDSKGVVIAVSPTWSVTAGGGTISANGLFIAGERPGTFPDTVRASSGTAVGTVTVTVTGVPSLGGAQSFAILGGTSVANKGTSAVTGSVGVSSSGGITGYPPGTISNGALHPGDQAASAAREGVVYAYQALNDAQCTNDFSGQTGRTLKPAVYCFLSTAQLSGDVVLDGQNDPNAIFIFQIKSTLTTLGGSRVLLANGAQAKNVYWQVGGSVTLGRDTAFAGNILAAADITLNRGAMLSGRALARDGAVLADSSNVSLPE